MDTLDALRAFVVVVDRGSFSAAARALRRSPASITRAVAAVEQRARAPLLRRTTRSLKLTDAGERYLAVARRVLADLDDVERQQTEQQAPAGLLSVTAPIAFGSLHVRPLVDELLAQHADMRAQLLLVDRVVSLVEEGVDVAVRVGALPDSALLATNVGSVRRLLVASPRYLERHGKPKTPQELVRHRCISSSALTPSDVWSFGAGRSSRPQRVRVAPVLSVNVADAAIRSAIAGVGVTCALSYQVSDALARGELVRLLAAHEPPPVPVHVVTVAAVARSARVRAFTALAVPALRLLLKSG